MQLLVLVGKEERRRPVAVLVICPLKSIIDNQIGKAEGFGNQSSRYRSPQII